MKNNRKGQAKLWDATVIKKMRSQLKSPYQRLIFEISLYTGERVGAICQLKVADIYAPNGKVLEAITFAANTRKSSKHGVAATRQVAIHADLKLALQNFNPPASGYLFASKSKSGHIIPRAVDKCWRKILTENGLYGYSTHSSRRWVINSMRATGIGVVTIAEALGMTINTVRHYLDNDPRECARAIATLSPV